MRRPLIFILILLNCSLLVSVSQAQLLRGNAAPSAAREPARVGLLGGLREARDERIRREEQAATAAARAAAAQRSAAANPRPNANAPANTQLLNPSQRSLEAANTNANSRTSSFRGPVGGTATRGQGNAAANSTINPNNSLSRATPVTPASATSFVPAPLGYDGPGVVIRLPKDARGVVSYLVDEAQTSSIEPGEEQVLDAKGSYVVRYSRGVTRDGRSFGESRYTITKGRYRFELTPTGWELFRESDSDANLAPPNQLDLAEGPLSERQSGSAQYDGVLLPEPSSQSELQRLPSQAVERPEARPNEPSARKPTPSKPVPSKPAVNEEVLPAPKPRSILE